MLSVSGLTPWVIRSSKTCSITKVRNLSFFWKLLALDKPESKETERHLYNWDDSPYETIRTRAAYIRTKALCPVTHKPVNFVCPISGIPTHYNEEAWRNDTEYHKKKTYELLKKVNLYEHDIRSGRVFEEFTFPNEQTHEFMINLSNWDTFFYTRDFPPMNTEFNLAAATKILTYPISIGAVLYKSSPYGQVPKGPVTIEGLRSLAALKYILYPPYTRHSENGVTFKERAMRIFILGAKSESLVPGFVWKQFGYLFPENKFEIHFIGPEAYFDRESKTFGPTNVPHGRPLVERVDEQITLHYHTRYFHEVYEMGDLFPFDPYLDIFFLFHPGFTTADKIYWDKAMKGLLDSKCPIYITAYHEKDMAREIQYLENHELHDEMDVLMNPTNNLFPCTKIELVDTNPTETFNMNSQIYAFRGKRYHAIKT
ncbi:zinc-finger of mitochondrial splicing suppressor 51-domain-containing protein [Scheffersomyces amazonensis]|uniref:zinc-finger of mitochondrial splicing suppressor 51-domain-containing protein n=1 Tax=Scheffersomyces amazonensis TaxID=1078765 RepID=UPI00315DFACC